jgi:myo-inositol 2-dehydrogenase/D-chiro-inositol 1-dehydrogenase
MKLALLGVDDNTAALAEAAVDAGHAIIAIYDPGSLTAKDVAAWAPGIQVVDDWQTLMADSRAEAVIVARARLGAEDVRTDQLRALIQAEVPLLVAHPVVGSMLAYYELDMSRQDNDCPLLPYVPARWHPAIDRLVGIVGQQETSPIGLIEQVVVERSFSQRRREDVLAWFARDVSVMRVLAGELNKLGAMTTANTGETTELANLNIQMSGPSGVLARWSVGSGDPAPGARLTLIGRRGKAMLYMPEASDAWKLELPTDDGTIAETFADWDPEAEGIDEFEAAIAGEAATPTWIDACRDMELVDAVQRSLERGRTIDLHFEEQTEDSTFKGMMAAGGCLLLMLVLGVLMLVAVVGQGRIFSFWPLVLVAVLVVFLGLQFLRLAFPPKKPKA